MKEKTADIDILESLDCGDDIELKNAISNLISENKELKEENEELKIIKSGIQALETNFAADDTYYVIGKRGFFKGDYRKLLDNYILKSKVEEKINKYNDILEYAETEEGMAEIKDFEYNEAKYGINVLQSLLGKE